MNSILLTLALIAPTLDVHVEGDGYMRFVRDGRTVYARDASLTVKDGKLAEVNGPLVNPRVQVPSDVTELRVDLSGRVTGIVGGAEKELGRIVLALFPDDVRMVVDSGFLVSSYRPDLSDAGVGTAGLLRTGKRGEKKATVIETAPAVTSGVEILLKTDVAVDGQTFTVGDIAEVIADPQTKAKIEALEVSTTPALGVPYRMTPNMVKVRLLRYGKEAETYKFSGSYQVTVTRKGQTVTPAMFADVAVKAATAELGGDVPFTAVNDPNEVVAPLGQLELVSEGVTVNGSRVSVRVAIIVDGVRFNSRIVSLDRSDAVSKIRIGQTVKLLVRSGTATVETTGRVRSIDKATGSVVVTAATGADLIGKVVAIDTVEVQL